MIQSPIPYFLGQYATFEDTLTTDDTTEALTLTSPDGTIVNVTYAQLTRIVNDGSNPLYPAGTFTYRWWQPLDEHSAWVGQFSSTGANANVAPVMAYVAL